MQGFANVALPMLLCQCCFADVACQGTAGVRPFFHIGVEWRRCETEHYKRGLMRNRQYVSHFKLKFRARASVVIFALYSLCLCACCCCCSLCLLALIRQPLYGHLRGLALEIAGML